jgi:hypothetical protein
VAERKNHTLIEMARIMLDEYKTSNQFWAEVISMACHATNHLYLHKLLKKTSYELLTGNKPNVSYFWVFRSKCYVLHKRSKSSKFAPKVYEGFLLGYDSNSRAYRVFNITTGCVETTCDAVFDETNGSQKEQVDLDLVDDEDAPCDTLQKWLSAMWGHKIQMINLKNLPQMIPLHPHKSLIKMNINRKMNSVIKFKRRETIMGEMRMMGIRDKHHHIQECATMFKEITPSATYLMISKKG